MYIIVVQSKPSPHRGSTILNQPLPLDNRSINIQFQNRLNWYEPLRLVKLQRCRTTSIFVWHYHRSCCCKCCCCNLYSDSKTRRRRTRSWWCSCCWWWWRLWLYHYSSGHQRSSRRWRRGSNIANWILIMLLQNFLWAHYVIWSIWQPWHFKYAAFLVWLFCWQFRKWQQKM